MWGEENGKGKEEMGNLLGNPILLHYYNKPNEDKYRIPNPELYYNKFQDQTPIHSR